MTGVARIGLLGAAIACALSLSPAASAGTPGGPFSDYCDPSATALDPVDVPEEGSDPVQREGVRRRGIDVDGTRTRVLESGDQDRRAAVVFMHGGPGSGADFQDLLPRVAKPDGRAIAFDTAGWGHAEDVWDDPGELDAGTKFMNRALDKLNVRRVHLVGHDVGGLRGVEWGKRHPRRLRSATLINTGLLLGYEHHDVAKISRSPFGEAFWGGTTRPTFIAGSEMGQSPSRPVPVSFLNRLYDDLDRESRCAIINLYRSADLAEIHETSRRQAEVLSDRENRPALVIWGELDPYLPVELAERQREGFPSARIKIFDDSGHWPFADNPERTRKLVVPVVRNAVERG